MAGPQPRMVIDYERSQDNWEVIQGNTDKLISDFSPKIYEEVTGKIYNDNIISKNKYFGAFELKVLNNICKELYPEEQLLAEMQCALLDIEAKAAAISNKKNVIVNFEKEIKKAFYRDEADAKQLAEERNARNEDYNDGLYSFME